MSVRAFCCLLLLLVPAMSLAAGEMSATAENGSKVILYPDGTWKYREPSAASKAGSDKAAKRSARATEKLELLRGKAAVYYDPSKWRLSKEPKPGRYEFEHRDGDAYAIVIAERMQMSLDALRSVVLHNAAEASPDVRAVAEEMRNVNGSKLLFMQTDGAVQGIPFSYLGYYYTGKPGAIQLITLTGQNLLDEYRADMEEFLNGFEAAQQ